MCEEIGKIRRIFQEVSKNILDTTRYFRENFEETFSEFRRDSLKIIKWKSRERNLKNCYLHKISN